MPILPFEFSLHSGGKVVGEWEVPSQGIQQRQPQNLVVFSHGFGVQRDSLGLFTAISKLISNTHILARFDYTQSDQNENHELVPPLAVQEEMLQTVITESQQKWQPQQTVVVAHSLGGVVLGLAAERIKIDQAILLACPLNSPYWRMRWRFFWHPRAQYQSQGESRIQRRNGKVMIIPEDFWPQIKSVMPLQLYKVLSQQTQLHFIQAKKDQVLWGEPWVKLRQISELDYKILPGDHNFTGESRKRLTNTLYEILQKVDIN